MSLSDKKFMSPRIFVIIVSFKCQSSGYLSEIFIHNVIDDNILNSAYVAKTCEKSTRLFCVVYIELHYQLTCL